MAKLAYFHLLTADNDDADLGAAKVMGYVPETCLLGGHLVWQSIALRRDPCGGCEGPREKCKGRAKLTGSELQVRTEVERLMGLFEKFR